jgi:probable HAF family extracellular repeat protein
MRKHVALLSLLLAGLYVGCSDAAPTAPADDASTLSAKVFKGASIVTSDQGVKMVVLSDPAWDESSAQALSGNSIVVGYCEFNPCMWRKGKLTFLPAEGYEAHAYGVNNRGQAVGFRLDRDYDRPVLWDKGVLTFLPTLAHPGGIARAINELGEVVGDGRDAAGHIRPFIYRGGVTRDLGTPNSDDSGVAWDINDSGQVVGYGYTQPGSHHALLWYKGQRTDLGTLSGTDYALPDAINNKGQIVGDSYTRSSNVYEAWIWERGRMRSLGISATRSWAHDINERSQIVGSFQATSDYSSARAYLWERGVLTKLGTFPGGGWSYASAINNHGHIVGGATDASGTTHAVMWLTK